MASLEYSSKSTLDSIVSSIGELPSAPSVLHKAIELTSDIESNITDISKVLSADQSLSTKVLRLSNSSFYGRQREVRTVAEAIQVLGFETVRSVVVAASCHQIFMETGEESISRRLWQHSLCTAVGARTLAAALKMKETEVAFIAGLLHDIGKLVIYSRIPATFKMLVKEVSERREPFFRIESEVLGYDHCDVGELLLSRWDFPTELVRPVARHHRGLAAPKIGQLPISRLVAVANAMAIKLGVCFPGQETALPFDDTMAEGIGLDHDRLCTVMDETYSHYQSDLEMMDQTKD